MAVINQKTSLHYLKQVCDIMGLDHEKVGDQMRVSWNGFSGIQEVTIQMTLHPNEEEQAKIIEVLTEARSG